MLKRLGTTAVGGCERDCGAVGGCKRQCEAVGECGRL